jgi:hypothetical protein
MALALILARQGLDGVLAAGSAWRIAALGALVAGGGALFVALAQWFGALDAAELWRALRRGAAAA